MTSSRPTPISSTPETTSIDAHRPAQPAGGLEEPVDGERREQERDAEAGRVGRRAARRPASPSPAARRRAGSRRGSGRCRASSRTRRRARPRRRRGARAGGVCTLARFSASSHWILKTPMVCSPSTMMTTPPIIPSVRLCSCSSEPTRVAAAPSDTKTVEKPSTKARLVRTTRRTRSRRRAALLELRDVHPADERQVARDDRQHAGRNEGDEAGQEGGGEGNRRCHRWNLLGAGAVATIIEARRGAARGPVVYLGDAPGRPP